METQIPNSNSLDSLEEEMNIYLKIIKTTAMKIKRTATVGDIKSAFCEMEGVSEDFHELFFNGDRFTDDQMVVDCGIQKYSTVHLISQSSIRRKLMVSIPSKHKSIVVEAMTYNTIQNIKSMILEREGIQPNQYNLVYAGRMLEDHATLASLDMQKTSAIHLVFNPKDIVKCFVKTPNGNTLNLEVKILYSVSDVKAIVGDLAGVLVSDYDLIYEGKQLDDSKSLACYDIQEDSILEMSSRIFQIFINSWSGKTITLEVHQHDTLQDVKKKIFQKLGVPQHFQSIVFGGKRLELHRDLVYYNIQKNATLHMVFAPSSITTKLKLNEIGCFATGAPNFLMTVRQLKAMIQKIVPTKVKEVYFNGKPLQDPQTIESYDIGMNDTLTVFSEDLCRSESGEET